VVARAGMHRKAPTGRACSLATRSSRWSWPGGAAPASAVDVAAGEYVEVVAEQQGVDVTIDSPRAAWRGSRLSADFAGGTTAANSTGSLPSDPGRHVIEIRASYRRSRGARLLVAPRSRPAGRPSAVERAYATRTSSRRSWGGSPTMVETRPRRCGRGSAQALRNAAGRVGSRSPIDAAKGKPSSCARMRPTARPRRGRGGVSDRAAAIYRELAWPAAEAQCLLRARSGGYIRVTSPARAGHGSVRSRWRSRSMIWHGGDRAQAAWGSRACRWMTSVAPATS